MQNALSTTTTGHLSALPLEHLLPLRAVDVTLRFTKPAAPKLFHQPALNAWLRFLTGDLPDYEHYLSLDAPAKGQVEYLPGDEYRFSLTAIRGGEILLQHLMRQFEKLPHSAVRRPGQPTFSNNLELVEMRDLFQQHVVQRVNDLSTYTFNDLRREAQLWTAVDQCCWRWLSPVRLSLPKAEQTAGGFKGEQRFCQHTAQLSFQLLQDRAHDCLAELLRKQGVSPPPRNNQDMPGLLNAEVFWVDFGYSNGRGRERPMGGLLGVMWLDILDLPPARLNNLILGQYLGIGQLRSSGWGRYELTTTTDESTVTRCPSASTLLHQSMTPARLQAAYTEVMARPAPPGTDTNTMSIAALHALREQLLQGQYEIPPLQAAPANTTADQPPLPDQILQQAVAASIEPALTTLYCQQAPAYRPIRRRETARNIVQSAYQDGYRWLCLMSLTDFLETRPWSQLAIRLDALFGDDPLVGWLLGWLQAPRKQHDGAISARRAGLPIGAPLTPVLGTLLLTDFARELSHQEMRLAYFADELVILCKTRTAAESIHAQIITDLTEANRTDHLDKLSVCSLDQDVCLFDYRFRNGQPLDTMRNTRPNISVKSTRVTKRKIALAQPTAEQTLSALADQAFALSMAVIKLNEQFISQPQTQPLSQSLLAAGTAPGSELRVATHAANPAMRRHCLEQALHATSNTLYWLELLYTADYLDTQTYETVHMQAVALQEALTAQLEPRR